MSESPRKKAIGDPRTVTTRPIPEAEPPRVKVRLVKIARVKTTFKTKGV